uniref:serine hydrolase domain-containing protein n=1 Tax=Actinomadura sp. CA-154981 TaxID=3240037 RepID=UPI003F49790B
MSAASFYEANPTYVDPRDDSAQWRISAPERQGVDSALLEDGVKSIDNHSLFSVLIARRDHLIYERYFNGSARHHANNLHSASKGILRMLLGVAIDEGRLDGLDVRVAELLPEYFGDPDGPDPEMTIRHLVTMSSGLKWKEEGTEYEIGHLPDRVGAILGQGQVSRPGEFYHYSTGNGHLVSAVLTRAVGTSVREFAQSRLFDPLGITVKHWATDPQGITTGGYDLYLTPREMMKLGLLMLHRGVWNGERVVPSAAIDEAREVVWHCDEPRFGYKSLGGLCYGQFLWIRTLRGHRMFYSWGANGQLIYVLPDLDLVLVTTENTAVGHDEQEIDAGAFIADHLIPAVRG